MMVASSNEDNQYLLILVHYQRGERLIEIVLLDMIVVFKSNAPEKFNTSSSGLKIINYLGRTFLHNFQTMQNPWLKNKQVH